MAALREVNINWVDVNTRPFNVLRLGENAMNSTNKCDWMLCMVDRDKTIRFTGNAMCHDLFLEEMVLKKPGVRMVLDVYGEKSQFKICFPTISTGTKIHVHNTEDL